MPNPKRDVNKKIFNYTNICEEVAIAPILTPASKIKNGLFKKTILIMLIILTS